MLSLKKVMRANAASCLFFGLLFVGLPPEIASFLGDARPIPAIAIAATGIVLVINGLHLLCAVRQNTTNKWLIWYFSAGDFAWVLGSILLIAFNIGVTTNTGILATTLIAVLVGGFGVLQLRMTQNMPNQTLD